jgi:hypothetical protein
MDTQRAGEKHSMQGGEETSQEMAQLHNFSQCHTYTLAHESVEVPPETWDGQARKQHVSNQIRNERVQHRKKRKTGV